MSEKSSVNQSELKKYVVSHCQTYYMILDSGLWTPDAGLYMLDPGRWALHLGS